MTTRSSTSVSAPELIAREKMSESERWRYVANNCVQTTSVGALVAGLVSLVLFRSIPSRVATTALGAGIGFGRSYVDARYMMGHDVPAHQQWVASVAPAAAATSPSN